MKKKDVDQMDRRKFLMNSFLGGAGLSSMASPAQIIFAAFFNQFMGKAHAQATGADTSFNDYNFVNILIELGTTRCLFDLPLKPSATDPFIQNAYCGNKLDANLNVLHQSVTHTNFNGIQMPYLWSSSIPRPGGSSIPMANLAPNLLMIRGINQQIDGHPVNQVLQTLPTPGLSTTGMAADASTTPVSAISIGDTLAFASKKGLSTKRVYSISDALSVFAGSTNLTEISNSSVDTAMNNLLNMMRDRPVEKHPFLPTTYLDRQNAKKLMKKNFGNLSQVFTDLQTKYADLITRSFTDASLYLDGVENLAIPGDFSSPKFGMFEGKRFTGTNIQDIITTQTRVNNLADSMAITEFLLVNRITSSIGVNIGALRNMNWTQYKDVASGSITTGEVSSLYLDFHFVGSILNVFFMTKYYRAVSACLYELISQLKNTPRPSGGNLFDRTILALNGDFNRNGRTDLSGSDHGFDGSSYTILSGMIQQCEVVGNITSDASNTYKGTWGKAAATASNGNRELLVGNAVSTLSTMMDLASPTPNDLSVVTKDASTGIVTPSFQRGKNV